MTSAATILGLFERAQEALGQACDADSAATRFAGAELAALRAAAAVVAARPAGRLGRTGPADVWLLAAASAPELGEWARYFAFVTRARRDRVSTRVSVREADDLLRDAESFLDEVAGVLGLPPVRDVPVRLAAVRSA